MAHHGFRGADRHPRAEKLRDGRALGRVVEGRRRAVRVDVIDLRRRAPRIGQRPLHGLPRADAARVRLGEVMIVRRDAVARDLRENRRPAPPRRLHFLQRENRRALAEHEPRAVLVERPDLFRRRSLERIEARKNHLRNHVVAAAQHALMQPRPHQPEGMPDRIRPRRAGIGDDLARARKPARLQRIEHRLLRQIIRQPRRPLVRPHLRHLRAVKLLPKTHPPARRPHHKQLRHKPRIPRLHLPRRRHHHPRSRMQLCNRESRIENRKFPHLSRHLAPRPAHVEARHRRHPIPPRSQRSRIFLHPDAKRTDHAQRRDGDATDRSSGISHGRAVFHRPRRDAQPAFLFVARAPSP